MRKPLYAAMLAITSLTFTSCQPDPDPVPVTQMYLRLGHEFAGNRAISNYPGPVFNVNGLLIQSKITASFQETDTTINLTRYRTQADFRDQLNPISAGDVAMNGTALPTGMLYPLVPSTALTYIHQSDSGSYWNENASNTWTVSGAGIIPQINYTVDNTFPEYTAALPAAVDTNSDLAITFNSGNVQNGDFAIITIAGELGSEHRESNPVPVNGGTASIPANTVKYIAAGAGKGRIAIHIYKQDLQNIGGKSFGFIKVREEWGTVTFQ